MIYAYLLFLANAVGSVGGLLFNSRIPPRVQMEYVVGSGKVEPQTSGLEGDEEYPLLSSLKRRHHLLAFAYRGRSVEVEVVSNSGIFHLLARHFKERGELAEYQHPVALLNYLLQLVYHQGKLAGRDVDALLYQRCRAGRLPEFGDHCQGVDVYC